MQPEEDSRQFWTCSCDVAPRLACTVLQWYQLSFHAFHLEMVQPPVFSEGSNHENAIIHMQGGDHCNQSQYQRWKVWRLRWLLFVYELQELTEAWIRGSGGQAGLAVLLFAWHWPDWRSLLGLAGLAGLMFYPMVCPRLVLVCEGLALLGGDWCGAGLLRTEARAGLVDWRWPGWGWRGGAVAWPRMQHIHS